MTTMRKVLILKRDPADSRLVGRLGADEALEFLVEHDFCNPHQLVRNERKMRMRREFFRKLFEHTEVYLVNTVEPPHRTHAEIVKIVRS